MRQRAEELRRVHAASQVLARVLRVHMTVRKLKALEPGLGVDPRHVEAGIALTDAQLNAVKLIVR